MISSHLEPADARRIFPCWDEPAFKATFALTVTLPRMFLAVSNMPVAHEEPVTPTLKQVTFQPPRRKCRATCSCWRRANSSGFPATPTAWRSASSPPRGKRAQGRFALDSAVDLLRYFNDYFGVKYPLPKLDLIAVPGGFGGAMENWGGITFFESRLLFDPADQRADRPARHLPHHRARDRAPMVRQSRHHGLVGQSLAQRGLCDLDAGQGRRALLSAMAAPGSTATSSKQYAMSASMRGAPRTRSSSRSPTRAKRSAIFDGITYSKGAGADPHAGALSRRERLSRRHPQIHGRSRLRQHHDGRPLARARNRLRQAGCGDCRHASPNRPGCR